MPTPIRRVKRRDPINMPPANIFGLNNGGQLTPSRDNKRPNPFDDSPASPSRAVTSKTGTNEPEQAQLNADETQLPITPQSMRKRTRHTPSELSAFCEAKALFQRGSRVRGVVGRHFEREEIRKFLNSSVKANKSGAVYVSGLPGTGKSALVGELMAELSGARTATLNCMTVDRPDQVFALVAKEFGYIERRSGMGRDQAVELLQDHFQQPSQSHVLMLDEIDHLMTSDQEVLFKLFEWACGKSNLVLVGIANAIDLTDRFLPRLVAHQLKPQVIAFKPYGASEIVSIIEGRLRSLGGTSTSYPVMHPAAVRICAAKIAANSGDLRMAFDVCRRSIELVEEESWAHGDYTENMHVSLLPKVTVPHVARVCAIAFGGVNTMARVKDLSFQQKAVLCVLIVEERSTASLSPNVTVQQVFQSYEKKAKNNPAMNALLYSEYLQVVTALEAAGLISVTGVCGKKGLGTTATVRSSRGGGGAVGSKLADGNRDDYNQRKISSKAQLMDVVTGLSDIEPLKQMLLGAL